MKINPALIKALKALGISTIASVVKLVMEYGLTVGAAGLVGMAHPVPGVVPSGSAAFAVLAAVRYFWVMEHRSQGHAEPVHVQAQRASQLAQSQALLDHLAEQIRHLDDEPASNKVAGPYL